MKTLIALLILCPLLSYSQTNSVALPKSILEADAKVYQLNAQCASLSAQRMKLVAKFNLEQRGGVVHSYADVLQEQKLLADFLNYQAKLQQAYQWDYRIRDSQHLPGLPVPREFGVLRK